MAAAEVSLFVVWDIRVIRLIWAFGFRVFVVIIFVGRFEMVV